MIVELLTTVLAFALIWTLVRRAALMSRSTKPAVRWAFTAQATAAFALAVLPWVWPEAWRICMVVLMASVLLVQVVTARHWQGAPPPQFQLPTVAANDSRPVPLREVAEWHVPR